MVYCGEVFDLRQALPEEWSRSNSCSATPPATTREGKESSDQRQNISSKPSGTKVLIFAAKMLRKMKKGDLLNA
jgi:hypothetical protein